MRFIAALLIALALPAQAQEAPEWFAETLLDVRQEAADAAKDGKRLVLYFWLSGCPYCKRMTETTFRDRAVVARFKAAFVPVAVNVRGDRDIVWTDGRTLSEKQLTSALAVRGTPTLLFFDQRGAVVQRLVGYVAPEALLRSLE